MSNRADPERGETLLELLIALVIMGIAVVAIIGGLASSITMSGLHRAQSTAGVIVRDYAESVQAYVNGTGYTPCAAPSAYAASQVGYTSTAASYVPTPISVTFWNGTSFVTSTPCADLGLQQLTIQVAAPDARVVEQLVVVLRKPCGVGTSCT